MERALTAALWPWYAATSAVWAATVPALLAHREAAVLEGFTLGAAVGYAAGKASQ